MGLAPQEITIKIMKRYSLDEETARNFVESTLGLQPAWNAGRIEIKRTQWYRFPYRVHCFLLHNVPSLRQHLPWSVCRLPAFCILVQRLCDTCIPILCGINYFLCSLHTSRDILFVVLQTHIYFITGVYLYLKICSPPCRAGGYFCLWHNYLARVGKADFRRLNRFTAEVMIDNHLEKVHVNNTGRLRDCCSPRQRICFRNR